MVAISLGIAAGKEGLQSYTNDKLWEKKFKGFFLLFSF